MNQTQARTTFTLHVCSQDSSNVWPMKARDHKDIDERIQKNYFADEDESSTFFEISDIEDLQKILKFYDGLTTRMTLSSSLEAPEFTANTSLANAWQRGIHGSFRMMEKEDLSPATAANKLIAISHALQRWEKDHLLCKPCPPKKP